MTPYIWGSPSGLSKLWFHQISVAGCLKKVENFSSFFPQAGRSFPGLGTLQIRVKTSVKPYLLEMDSYPHIHRLYYEYC